MPNCKMVSPTPVINTRVYTAYSLVPEPVLLALKFTLSLLNTVIIEVSTKFYGCQELF